LTSRTLCTTQPIRDGRHEKESDDKEDDDNASQALRKSNKSETTSKWSGLTVRKESLLNNGEQWATGTKGNSILLDNGSTLSLSGNPNSMVKNIRESKTTLELAMNADHMPDAYEQTLRSLLLRNIFGLLLYPD
jgi:hypothetical protein